MLQRFLKEEEGMSTIEIVVITAVLLAMAITFKDVMFVFFGNLIKKVIGIDI